MLKKQIFVMILVLALVTMACGFNINLPVERIQTGETVTEKILVENLDDPEAVAMVTLEFGAGELRLSPGAEGALISGTAVYNVRDFKPQISVQGDNVTVSTGDLEIRGIPNFNSTEYKNEWDLSLGDAPMELRVNAGAYQGEIELGGLALHALQVGDGASDVSLSFSELNLVEMSSLSYETGASQVELRDLANANFERMIFKGGAGDYTLDFSGELQRDAEVQVEAGICDLTIIVPDGVPVQVEMEGGLTDVDTRGSWDRSGTTYTAEGSGLAITIQVKMGAGRLNLEIR
jgi:hypothetical protein